MNFRLNELLVHCKQGAERVPFSDFTYFYGQMGAGKSTIARLIDYSLAGDLELTPAMQSEFVAATLSLRVAGNDVTLTRNRESDQIRAQWEKSGEPFDAIIPARTGNVEVVHNTSIEVLSDLFFVLSGVKPPKVRRSKLKEDSELGRLSLRDLLWYCYLDQDSMDSSFFNLDSDANPFKKLKSRDVLRFIVGFHQESVAELEAELEAIREERLRCEGAVKAIREALTSSQLSSPLELQARRNQLQQNLQAVEAHIGQARTTVQQHSTHEMDVLRERARTLGAELGKCELALRELAESIEHDTSHRNTLLSLASRFKRAQSAREVLSGVEFKECPRCGRTLPVRPSEACVLCGQDQGGEPVRAVTDEAIDSDVTSRVQELEQRIHLQKQQQLVLQRKRTELGNAKAVTDQELNRVSHSYDSAYLSSALHLEKERAALVQQLTDMKELEVLVSRIDQLSQEVENLAGREHGIRQQLREARKQAEQDTSNVDLLKQLFLDCLLRSRLPGFFSEDSVEIKPPHFLPEVLGKNTGDLAVTSFANLGSGGKKCLFKCCFAVALHRLAVQTKALLPTILIIDSPMKNISERENRQQFVGFHEMLHELVQGELKGTQVILIDKELQTPAQGFTPSFNPRHMTPDDAANPPLIRYYRGH